MELTNYGLVSVTRKLGAHYVEKKGEENYLTDDVLAICLPFGNSSELCLKLKYFKEKFYFSIVRIFTNDQGMGIICVFNSIRDILDDRLETIKEIVNFLNSKTNNSSQIYLDFDSITINSELVSHIDNIQSAIISMLIQKKIFVLDYDYQIFSLILSFIELLPEKFHSFLDFTIDSTSYTENINIMSFQNTKDILTQFSNLEHDKSTIIDIKNQVCFGIYSSPLLNAVINHLQKGSLEAARALLKVYETLIFETDNISIKSAEITKKNKISKTDIKIIDQIRLNLLNLPEQRNIFEELIK